MLAAIGAVAGLILASWGADLLLGYFVTADTPRAVTANPDGRVLLFTCALTVVHGAAGRDPARVPQHPRRRRARAEGLGRRRRARRTAPAQDARRRAVRAVVHAADRGGTLPSQPPQPDGGRSRVPHVADADVQLRSVAQRLRPRQGRGIHDHLPRHGDARAGRLLGGLHVPAAAWQRRLGHGPHRRGLSASIRRERRRGAQRGEPRLLQDDGHSAARRARVRQPRRPRDGNSRGMAVPGRGRQRDLREALLQGAQPDRPAHRDRRQPGHADGDRGRRAREGHALCRDPGRAGRASVLPVPAGDDRGPDDVRPDVRGSLRGDEGDQGRDGGAGSADRRSTTSARSKSGWNDRW